MSLSDSLYQVRGILQETAAKCAAHRSEDPFPYITLTYAQSLDGCITKISGQPLKISSDLSMTFTHELRSIHDVILVGVGTIIADNPSLTVRFADGDNPQPVIIDSMLRCPADCKLFTSEECRPPIIMTCAAGLEGSNEIDEKKMKAKAQLEDAGATIVVCESSVLSNGPSRVNLKDALRRLRDYNSVMIEGGASIITSCLETDVFEHINQVILTIAPFWVGGPRSVTHIIGSDANTFPRLQNVSTALLTGDVIVHGYPS